MGGMTIIAAPEPHGICTMAAAEYHASAALSSSGARQIMRECPARYIADRAAPPEPSPAQDIGTAAHEWLLEGETWPQKFTLLPHDHNGRTNAGKERIAAIEADGKRPLHVEEFTIIKAMKEALQAHPFARHAFADGKAEQSLFWRDPEFGILCRARPDFLPATRPIIPDYKTTVSAHPDYLKKAIWNFGYHQQADWYLTGIRELGIFERPTFLFVFQEKQPPYLVVCVTPDDEALGWAGLQNRKAREIFARCQATGKWPGYTDDVLTLGLPAWAGQQLQREHEGGSFEIAYEAQRPLTAA